MDYCNGNGFLRCRCGGDFCVCGLDGEECFGCKNCESNIDDIEFESGYLEESHKIFDDKVDSVYKEFWKDIIEKDGFIDNKQVRKELYDFKIMMDTFQKVVNEIGSCSGISKLTYQPHVYLSALEDYVDQAIEAAKEDWKLENKD